MAVPYKDPLSTVIVIDDRGDKSVAVTPRNKVTDLLDLYFLQEKATGLLLAADTVADTRTVSLATGHGLTTANSAGHILEVADIADSKFYQGEILSITGDVVTVSPPMSRVFTTTGALVSTGNPNMCKDAATGVAIDGSITPVIFTVKPLPSQSGDITRTIFATRSENASDLTTFGGAAALTVGLTLRHKNGDGFYKNIFTYRDNFDLAIHGFDTAVFSPKQGGTIKGLLARTTYSGQEKHDSAIRLDGALSEELQIVVSELMDSTPTGNLSVKMVAEGSELQGR